MMRHSDSQYKPARFHFTDPQISKIKKGRKVRVAHNQMGTGPHVILLHPVQHAKLSQAHAKGKGADVLVSDGEILHSIDSNIEGTGIWDTIKSGFNKYVKPVLSGVGDAIAYANPELAPLREGVRGLTGVGLKKSNKGKKAKKPVYKSESEEELPMRKPSKSRKRAIHGSGLYL